MKSRIMKSRRGLALVIVLACALMGLALPWQAYTLRTSNDIVGSDTIDAGCIVRGLETAPHFSDSLKWWSSPWAGASGVPEQPYATRYYRPLISMLWWCEYRVFGRNGLVGFMTVHFLLHFVAIGVVFALLQTLFGWRIATLAACLFGLNEAVALSLPSPFAALFAWKDDVEMWVTIAYASCLLCFLHGLRSARGPFYGGALALFAAAVWIKEMAYSLPFAVLLLLWHEGKLRTHWRTLAPYGVLAALLFSWRWHALQGMGTQRGSNGSWLPRFTLNAVGGQVAASISHGDGLTVGAAFLLLLTGVIVAWRGKRIATPVACRWAGGLGLGAVFAYQLAEAQLPEHDNLFLRLVVLLAPNTYVTFLLVELFWINVAACSLLIAFWLDFAAHRTKAQVFGWGWVLITYLPLLNGATTEHTLYLIAWGWALWLAVGLLRLADAVRHHAYKIPSRWVAHKERFA